MLICITGQIGSGKTSLLNEFKSLGFKTFEMDKYIHEIYKKNKIGYQLIKKNFGDSYVNEIEVDRKKLGQLVFNDNKKLNKLNSLTIPLIRQKILELKNINEHISYLMIYLIILFLLKESLKLKQKSYKTFLDSIKSLTFFHHLKFMKKKGLLF